MTLQHFVVAARGGTGEAPRVVVRAPVVDRRTRQRREIVASILDSDVTLGDVEQRRDVIRSKNSGRVITRLLFFADDGEARADVAGDRLRNVPMISFEHEQRIIEIGWLADRRQRFQRMQREAVTHARLRAAGVKDDRRRLRNERRHFIDGAIAHGDQQKIGMKLIDRFARRSEQLRQTALRLRAQPDAVDRPSDATPRRAVRPRGAAAAENGEAEVHCGGE